MPDASEYVLTAWRRFTPRFFNGRAVHFWASLRPEGDTLDGWEDLAASVEKLEVSGDHVSLFEPENAEAFASALRSVTDAVSVEAPVR